MRKYIILVAIILFFVATEQREPSTTQPIEAQENNTLSLYTVSVGTEYVEFSNFLVNNSTSENKYNDDQNVGYKYRYVCAHFTRDLITSATKAGYKMYAVTLTGTTKPGVYWWHSIATVRLDNKWYFVEPQTDKIILITDAYKKYKYEYAYIGKTVHINDDYAELNDMVRHEKGLINGDFIYLRGMYEWSRQTLPE